MSEERYREKQCPSCGKTHKKRGPYCSRSCGGSRKHTEEDKKKRSVKLKEYYETPEGIATKKILSATIAAKNSGKDVSIPQAEDFAIDIPDVRDLTDYEFDNYDRAEKW